MSSIGKADVEYVAGLAQLELSEEAKERLVHEMGDILAYMDQLNSLEAAGFADVDCFYKYCNFAVYAGRKTDEVY